MRLPVSNLCGQPSSGAWRLLRHQTLGRRATAQVATAAAAAIVIVVHGASDGSVA